MQKHFITQQFWVVSELFWFTLNKIPRVMKLYIFLLFCSIGLAQAANSYAQNATVNLKMQNQTVQTVLDEIENQSEFSFFFNTKHVDLNRKVSIDAENSDIFKVLDHIFSGTNVKYSVVDKKVILSTELVLQPSVSQNKKTVSGIVKDENGEPIIGANVIEKGTDRYGWQIYFRGIIFYCCFAVILYWLFDKRESYPSPVYQRRPGSASCPFSKAKTRASGNNPILSSRRYYRNHLAIHQSYESRFQPDKNNHFSARFPAGTGMENRGRLFQRLS